MGLAQTRPEKSHAMGLLVQALRDAMIDVVLKEELNIAESVNGVAHLMASIMVGAYDDKNRMVVLSGFPDVVRAYYPQWEKIYAEQRHALVAEDRIEER